MLTVSQIITQLKTDDYSFFPREALEQAVIQQEAITPLLLDIIEGVANNPKSIDDTHAYFFALFLLAQFKESKAYPLIIKYFGGLGLDITELDPTGDLVTESLHKILASVCDGDLCLIKQLIEDSKVNVFVRDAALRALVVLYNNDLLSRKELVNYIQSQIDLYLLKPNDPFFISTLVRVTCTIHPEELYDQLVSCFEKNLIDTQMINLNDLDSYRTEDKETTLIELKSDPRSQFIKDTIAETEWWYCFNPDRYSTPIHDGTLKLGRNDLCFCGSGKKYKKCCLH